MSDVDWPGQLAEVCRAVAALLAARGRRVVFAESCTAGLVSASLAAVPGISRFLCGSAVTYREDTKQRWLGVAAEILAEHTAVSAPVARQMAAGVLQRTPEADLALSVTGHLGPEVPADQDGLVFVGVALRGEPDRVVVREVHLGAVDRAARQQEAAVQVLHLARNTLESTLKEGA